MVTFAIRWVVGLASVLICLTAKSGELTEIETVKLTGTIADARDISALGLVGEFLVIGADETDRCQILRAADRGYVLLPENDVIFSEKGKEVDIEGICCQGNQVYAIGSHSCVRPELDKDKSYRKNRIEIAQIRFHPTRDLLARFALDENGKASSLEKISLRSVIEKDPILGPFARIPGKENGVNIEGLAVKEGLLYVGFRSPILRDNFVPILICDFDHVSAAKLTFVRLEGLGIRGISSTKDGFLILAGPMGNGPGAFKLFFWNGLDCLPGVDRAEKAGEIRELCKIPQEEKAKPEGIVLTKESELYYEFTISFDAPKKSEIKRFQLSKS